MTRSPPARPNLYIVLIGGAGFVLLLAAAQYAPDLADVLRGAAVAWLAVFAVIDITRRGWFRPR
jgi:hypothetical protein